MNGYGGGNYLYLYNNQLSGNLTLTDVAGYTGGYNDIGTGCGSPKYVPYDDNNASSSVNETSSGVDATCPWSTSNGTVGNFLGRLTHELNHNHAINPDGSHSHTNNFYAHRHWLKARATSAAADHTHTVPDHGHSVSVTVIGAITGTSATETRPDNVAVIFWRRTN